MFMITFEGIRACLKLMTEPGVVSAGGQPGVMIPIPQYPLYSASLAEYNMAQVQSALAAAIGHIFKNSQILVVIVYTHP